MYGGEKQNKILENVMTWSIVKILHDDFFSLKYEKKG